MKLAVTISPLVLLATVSAHAAVPPPAVIPFDAAHLVATPLDLAPVTSFAFDGPPPVLFVDLPGSSPFTFLDSQWFFGGVRQFTLTPTHALGLEQFWMQPSEFVWATEKSAGNWRVDTRYSFGDILFAENGGIGVGITTATGTASVNFTVAPTPVPAPAALTPFAAALALLRLRFRRH